MLCTKVSDEYGHRLRQALNQSLVELGMCDKRLISTHVTERSQLGSLLDSIVEVEFATKFSLDR
jgi:hypothetical protein